MHGATLEVGHADRRFWDAIVVGAGPAGALAARELARWHCSVLLVDKAVFPRSKVCGCCLNGRALAVLREADLGHLPATRGAVQLADILLATPLSLARVPLVDELALSREAFDASLVEAAIAAGVTFLPRTLATLGHVETTRRGIILQQDDRRIEVGARLVLAADGLGNKLLHGQSQVTSHSRIGAGVLIEDRSDFYRSGTIFMACGRQGYVGVVRVEDGRLDVACALNPEAVRAGGPGGTATAIIREAGLPALAGLANAPWRGTPALTRQNLRPAAERLFVIGDAAGYVEPFTGEGIGWALRSARDVIPLAVRAIRDWQPELADEWTRLQRATMYRQQLPCRALAGVLRRPMLIQAVVALLARWPTLAAPVLHRLHQPGGRA